MVHLLLVKVKSRMRASGVQLDLSPQDLIELLPQVEQVVLIGIMPDKLVDECLVQFMVVMFGLRP